jgi:hypothetical protein
MFIKVPCICKYRSNGRRVLGTPLVIHSELPPISTRAGSTKRGEMMILIRKGVTFRIIWGKAVVGMWGVVGI